MLALLLTVYIYALVQGASEEGRPTNKVLMGLAAASAALFLSSSTPATAALNTDTYKAGAAAKIEASDLSNQSAADVVRTLKQEVLPKVTAKLQEAANSTPDKYSDSIVKELQTVKSEIDALESQLTQDGGSNSSNIKSMASAIEQQVNALKANLGFD